MPTQTALAMNASALYAGVTTPMPAALSSSSRIATRPSPNLERRIQAVIATLIRSRASRE